MNNDGVKCESFLCLVSVLCNIILIKRPTIEHTVCEM